MTTKTTPVIYDEDAVTAGTISASDTNITGTAWYKLLRDGSRGVATGMNLTLSTTSDTATLSTGRGVWWGYVLEVTATHTVSLPAVSSAKTYSIGVLYDPANYSTAAGCLSIAVFDKNSITIPTSGTFFTLYEVDRTSSQSLAASTVRNYRYCASSSIYIPAGVLLPPAVQHTYGTIAVTPTAVYQRRGGSGLELWDEVTDDTGEQTSGFGPVTGWSNSSAVWSKTRGAVFLDLTSTRTGSSFTASSSGSLSDMALTILPASARPKRMWAGSGGISLAGSGATMGCDVRIYSDGRVNLTSTAPGLVVPKGSNIYVSATYRN